MNQPQPLQFKGFQSIGYWSHRGKAREENEDSFYVPPSNLSPEILQRKGYLCLVADGMGGHAKGEVASQLAARRIAEEYYADPNPDPEQALHRAIQVANAEIHAVAQHSEMSGMGTTAVIALSVGNRLVVANVGDSRAYLISQGQAIQITRDHSWVQDRVEEGTLTKEQAQQHAQKNLITRSLGSQSQVEVDMFTPAAEPGELVLLCSDGLSNMVRPEEIARTGSQFAPHTAAERLVALANERGGPDNITAVILPVGTGVGAVPMYRRRARSPMLFPVAASAVFGLLLIIAAALLGRTAQNQGAIAQLAKTTVTQSAPGTVPSTITATTPTHVPFFAPSVVSNALTQTRTATSATMPTLMSTPVPLPSPTVSQSQTTTLVTPILVPLPSSSLQPAPPRTPPPRELHYNVKKGQYAGKLAEYFAGDASKWREFLWESRNQEIISPSCKDLPPSRMRDDCLRPGELVVQWEKLNPFPIENGEREFAGKPQLWLVGQIHRDGWKGVDGTKEIFGGLTDNQWVIARAKQIQGVLKVIPLEITTEDKEMIVFILNGKGYYEEKKVP